MSNSTMPLPGLMIIGPPTDLKSLCITIAEDVVDKVAELIFQPAWQAFEASLVENNPPAAAIDGGGTLYVFYASKPLDTQYLFYQTWNGTAWSGQQILDVALTQTGPGAVAFNGQVYVFWQGWGSSMNPLTGKLYYCIIDQAYNWQINYGQTIPGFSEGVIMSNCPSAVVFNSQIYVFYQGPGPDGQLWYTKSGGGPDASWSPSANWPNTGIATSPSAVVFTNPSGQEYLYVFYQNSGTGYLSYTTMNTAGTTTGGAWIEIGGQPIPMTAVPGATVYNNNIYVFYNGASGGFWYVSSSDGITWNAPIQVAPIQCTGSPSLAMLGSQLYCMMQGPDYDGKLWYTAITPGTPCAWMTWVTGETMSASPGTVVWNDQNLIYCFIQGEGNSSSLYCCTYGQSGWNPSVKVLDNGSMSWCAAPVLFNSELYVFYQGPNNDTSLVYITSSDGVHWSAPSTVYNTGVSIWPAAVEFNQELYVFHGGKDGPELWYNRLNTSGSWVGDTKINTPNITYNTTIAPAAIKFNGTLYVFYVAGGYIYFSCSNDGSNWGNPTQVSSSINTTSAVALITNDDGTLLYCAYQDGSSGYVYYISTSLPELDTNWSAPAQLGISAPTSNPPGAIAAATNYAISCICAFDLG